ncbi:hypothetical protein BDZ89DRAFT_182563 [Hymenopellis radicata]|nr:hypothetical protein BDZ89DRAFT_182563 [Hymenopellis radicata]
MGPEPDIYGYNQLEDESDMYAGEGEGERYPLYEKKDIEREFEKIRDQTTPAHKFVPSKLSRRKADAARRSGRPNARPSLSRRKSALSRPSQTWLSRRTWRPCSEM